jgi:hypothetical protein
MIKPTEIFHVFYIFKDYKLPTKRTFKVKMYARMKRTFFYSCCIFLIIHSTCLLLDIIQPYRSVYTDCARIGLGTVAVQSSYSNLAR